MTLWQRTHPHAHPELLEEEEPDEFVMPEHDAPVPEVSEPQEAHEEAPVLKRFLALRIVYVDGLRRMPGTSAN